MPSKAMTDQELRDYAADNIYYELWMLYETAMRLKHEKAIDTDFVLKNAFIESFTIHARALAFFLYFGPKPTRKKPKTTRDVTAEDYVRDVTAWKAARRPIPVELQQVIDRTGKEIAHLTTGRFPAGDPRKGWTFEHVYRLFFGPLHLFLRHTDPARLDASVPAFIRELPTPPGSPIVYGKGPSPLDEPGFRTDIATP